MGGFEEHLAKGALGVFINLSHIGYEIIPGDGPWYGKEVENRQKGGLFPVPPQTSGGYMEL
jgi:hypothetical protein